MKSTFGTALNCIDGRTQIPVIEWMKKNACVDYVDMITEPGMVRVLSQDNWNVLDRLAVSVNISIEAHHSKIVAVVGHYDCAANPVDIEQHYKDIIMATNVVKSWAFPVTVIGLWVDECGCVHLVEK